MQYRAARMSDIEDLMVLDASIFGYFTAWTVVGWEVFVRDSYFSVIVAVDDGELVGYYLTHRFEKHTEIICIGVLPSYRGKGIADQFMRRIFEIKKPKILAVVRESCYSGLKFYRRYGFSAAGIDAQAFEFLSEGKVYFEDGYRMVFRHDGKREPFVSYNRIMQ